MKVININHFKKMIYSLVLLSSFYKLKAQEISNSPSQTQSSSRLQIRHFVKTPIRKGRTLCSKEVSQENYRTLNKCVKNFPDLDLVRAIKSDELMDPLHCPTKPETSLMLAQGCWEAVGISPEEMRNNVLARLGSDVYRYENEIEEGCPNKPAEVSNGVLRRFNRGQLNPREIATIKLQQAEIAKFVACRDKVIASTKRAQENSTNANRQVFKEITPLCDSRHPQIGRGYNYKRERAHKACLIQEAVNRGCTRCVEGLTGMSIGEKFLQNLETLKKQWDGLECFNTKTLGRIFCEAGALATAVTGVSVTTTKLFKYFGSQLTSELTEQTRKQLTDSIRQHTSDAIDASGDIEDVQEALLEDNTEKEALEILSEEDKRL